MIIGVAGGGILSMSSGVLHKCTPAPRWPICGLMISGCFSSSDFAMLRSPITQLSGAGIPAWRSSFEVMIFFFFNDTATNEIYTLSLHDGLLARLGPVHFVFNDTATPEIYTLALHDALPI